MYLVNNFKVAREYVITHLIILKLYSAGLVYETRAKQTCVKKLYTI